MEQNTLKMKEYKGISESMCTRKQTNVSRVALCCEKWTVSKRYSCRYCVQLSFGVLFSS